MADEITITVAAVAAKSGAYVEFESDAATIDMSGADLGQWTQSIPTTTNGEALAVPGDVSYPCHLIIKNPSSNTYAITIYKDNAETHQIGTLNPGDPAQVFVRINQVPYLKAATSAQTIFALAIEA